MNEETIDRNEERELEELKERLGIEESDDGNGGFKMTVSFSYDPDSYESDIAPNPALKDKVDEIDSDAVAEDEDVASAANQCQATFAQCQAKNPYACRYHGQKLMEGDMNAELQKAGIANATVSIAPNGASGNYILSVGGLKTTKQRKAAADAIDAFLKKGGIDQSNARNLGYKRTQKSNIAMFGVSEEQPAQVSGQGAGGSLHPPKRPPEPPKWTGLSDDDFDYLDKASLDLAFLVQRLDHNLSKQPPDPNPGSMAAQNFAAIDRKKLEDAAKKDSTGQAQRILDIYDEAKKSEANGWNDKILASKYDESKYNSSDPKASTDFASWGFDRKKCPKDPHAAARKAYAEWVPPATERSNELSMMKSALAAASAKEKPALDGLMKDAEEASSDMESFEDNAGLLDDAIANETDPDAKNELQELLKDLDSSYRASKSRYDDAMGKLKKWSASQSTMTESFGYDEIENFYKSRGLPIPLGVKNWKAFITDQKLQDDSEAIIMKNVKFNSRPMWQTHQQRLDRIKQLRKNLCLLMPHMHIYHMGDDHCEVSIANDSAVRANSNASTYQQALKNAFGVKRQGSANDMQLYCAMSIEKPQKSFWCTSSPYHNREYVIELDPTKTIGGIVWGNGCGYWSSSRPKGMNHVSQMNFSDLAYDGGSNTFNPEAAEVDFTGMTPDQMMKIMFQYGEDSYEFHPVNGADFRSGNTKAVHEWKGSISKRMMAVIKKYNVEAYDAKGNKI